MLVFLLAGIFKEKSDTLNSLGFAAFLVCLNPYAVTDAGALLTFTAVLGLALIRPCFSSRILHKSRVIGYFSDIFLSTVSVFITTFPVMYFMFGAVSLAAFVINLILIPITDVLLVCGVLFAALSDVNHISDILIFIIKGVTGFMLKTVDVFADFKYSAVSIDSPIYALAISAVFLIFGIGFLFKKEKTMKLCALFSAAVFAFSVLTVNIVNRDKTFVRTVSGSYSTCVIAYDREYCLVIGCREYNQYYTAQNVISSNSLKLVLVGENSASLYSAFLANNFDAMNFIGTQSNEFLNENINISDTDYFDVDLWQGVNVKYTYENEKQTYVITAGGTSLIFNGTVLNSPAEQDALYTIDKNGYSLQGVNKWLK